MRMVVDRRRTHDDSPMRPTISQPTADRRALDRPLLDAALGTLRERREEWAHLSIEDKIAYLEELRDLATAIAPEWVAAAVKAKGIPEGSPAVGEEWMSGPWALIAGLVGLIRTLDRIAQHQDPLEGHDIRVRPDGQTIVRVYPSNQFEFLLMSAYSAEVWMQPGISPAEARANAGAHYTKEQNPEGGVALVLGAGNIASIAPLDMLYELIAEGRVVLCKMNPVNDYLGPFFERIFAPLIDAGYAAFAYGGADVGEYLVRHEHVDKIHITGSGRTHDAIVFGPGEEGRKNKAAAKPILEKPITSELGGVGPTIVLPGPWNEADMRYQAEHIATQKFHNAGFNCIAAQVLVLHREWPQRERFLEILEETIRDLPPRHPYYPGAADRQRSAAEAHPAKLLGGEVPRTRLADIDPKDTDAHAFTTEFFGGVWAETSLSAPDPASFLSAAIDFANDRLVGTLGAQIIAHPSTLRHLGDHLEDALGALRYGTIGVNAWSGVGFLLPLGTWGAYPGHPIEDIQSGCGVVHNALLLDRPEKTIVRGQFAPFPRSVGLGELHFSPKPPWFVTHRNSERVGALLTDFEADPNWAKLPAIFLAALTG